MKINFGPYVEYPYKRKMEVHFDEWDTFGAYKDLATIISPLLQKLEEDKHGVPFVDNEDVPSYLRNEPIDDCGNQDIDRMIAKWNWVLDRMIYSMSYLASDEFFIIEYQWVNTDLVYKDFGINCYNVKELEKDILKIDPFEDLDEYFNGSTRRNYIRTDFYLHRKHEKYVQEGLELFGKYFQSLWT